MKAILMGLGLAAAVGVNGYSVCPNGNGGATIAPAGVSPLGSKCGKNAEAQTCGDGEKLAECVDVLFVMDRSHSITGGDPLFDVQAQTSLQYSESIMLTVANELFKAQDSPKIAEIGLVTFTTTSSTKKWYYPLTQGGITADNLLSFTNKVQGICMVNGDKDYTNPIAGYRVALKSQFPRRRGIDANGQACEVPIVVVMITDGTPTTQQGGGQYPSVKFQEEYNFCPNPTLVVSALKQAGIVKNENSVTLATVGIGSRLECTCKVGTYGNTFTNDCEKDWSISSCFLRQSSSQNGGPAFHPDFYFPTLNQPKKQVDVPEAVKQIVCGESGYPNGYGLMQAIKRVAATNINSCCFSNAPTTPTPQPTKPTPQPGTPTKPTTKSPTPKTTPAPSPASNLDLLVLFDTSGSIFGNNPEEAKEPTLCAGVGVGASPIFPAAVNGFFPAGGYYPITAQGAVQPDACWLVFVALLRDVVQKLVEKPNNGDALMPWASQTSTGGGLRLSVSAFWCDGKQTLPRTQSLVPASGAGDEFFDGTGMTNDFSYVDTFTNPNAASPPFNTLFNNIVKFKSIPGTGTGTCPDYSLADFINLVEQTWQVSAQDGRTNRVLLTLSDLIMYDAVRNPSGVVKTLVTAMSERCIVPMAFSPIGPSIIGASYDDKFACAFPPCCTGSNICPKANQAKQYAALMTNFQESNGVFYLYGTNPNGFVPTPPGNLPAVATSFLGKVFSFAFPITQGNPTCKNPAAYGTDGIDNRYCGYTKGVCLKQCTYSEAIIRNLKQGGPELLKKDDQFIQGCSNQAQRQACEFLSGGQGCRKQA